MFYFSKQRYLNNYMSSDSLYYILNAPTVARHPPLKKKIHRKSMSPVCPDLFALPTISP